MSDLISRQAAIDEFYMDTCDVDKVAWAETVLKRVPSAEPERKKGHWISLDDFRGKYNDRGYKCSECDEHSDYEENFCPNCGARMESE